MRSETFRHRTVWPHQEATPVGSSFPTKHDVISRQLKVLKCTLVQFSGCSGEKQILWYGADFYFCYCQESPTIDTFSSVVQMCSVVQIGIEMIEPCLGFAHSTLRPYIKIYRKQLSSDSSKQLEGKRIFPPLWQKPISSFEEQELFPTPISHTHSPVSTSMDTRSCSLNLISVVTNYPDLCC